MPLVILLCYPVSALQGRICWLCCVSYSSKSNTYSADQQNKQHYVKLANARCNYLPVILVKGFFAWQQCWWSCASIIGLQAVSFHMLNLKRWACASKWWFHMNCIYTYLHAGHWRRFQVAHSHIHAEKVFISAILPGCRRRIYESTSWFLGPTSLLTSWKIAWAGNPFWYLECRNNHFKN